MVALEIGSQGTTREQADLTERASTIAREQALGSQPRPQIALVARVHCEFESGRTITTYATAVNMGAMVCLSPDPPHVGTPLVVRIHLKGLPPLPPVEARVIASRVDPDCAEACWFEVVFTTPDGVFLRRLAASLPVVQEILRMDVRRRALPVPERRVHPRVESRLGALVRTRSGHTGAAVIKNLSMDGAYISFEPGPHAPVLTVGDTMDIRILGPRGEEDRVHAGARVVRMEQDGRRPAAGVRFLGLDGAARASIERLIVSLLVPGE